MTDDPHGPGCTCGGNHTATSPCHRTTLLPCPHHFEFLALTSMRYATDTDPVERRRFTRALHGLHDMNAARAAYHTWMAMLGRWAVPPGMDRDEVLAKPMAMPELGRGAPPHMPTTMRLMNVASRAAIAGDTDVVFDSLVAASRELDTRGMVSFLGSTCASAAIACSNADADTVASRAYMRLGSQLRNREGCAMLADLVVLVEAHAGEATDAKTEAGMAAAGRVLHDATAQQTLAAMELVGRTVGQMTEPDATLMTSGGPGGDGLGVVDWRTATPGDGPGSEWWMPGVWAMRAADAYVGAATLPDMGVRVRALADSYPGLAMDFVADVIIGGTQMLGYMIGSEEMADRAR